MILDSLPEPVSPSLVSPFPSASNATNTSHSNLASEFQSRSNSVKCFNTVIFCRWLSPQLHVYQEDEHREPSQCETDKVWGQS